MEAVRLWHQWWAGDAGRYGSDCSRYNAADTINLEPLAACSLNGSSPDTAHLLSAILQPAPRAGRDRYRDTAPAVDRHWARQKRVMSVALNQDTLPSSNNCHRRLGVADGMGGHPAGDLAAQTRRGHLADIAARRTQRPLAPGALTPQAPLPRQTMLRARHSGNPSLNLIDKPSAEGDGNHLVVAHDITPVSHAGRPHLITSAIAGPIYIEIRPLNQFYARPYPRSKNRSASGQLTPEQATALTHPDRHILTRAWGLGPNIET